VIIVKAPVTMRKGLPPCNTELPTYVVISDTIQHHHGRRLWLWHELLYFSVCRLISRAAAGMNKRIKAKRSWCLRLFLYRPTAEIGRVVWQDLAIVTCANSDKPLRSWYDISNTIRISISVWVEPGVGTNVTRTLECRRSLRLALD